MADPKEALATQLANIEKRTGKSLDQLAKIIEKSGLSKHGQLVAMLKEELGMGHGDANTVVHMVKKAREEGGDSGQPSPEEVLDGLYTGKKAHLRPIHDRLLGELGALGTFDVAPKKSYVSYRRKKQFCMIGPATNSQVEVGINAKGLEATDRLQELPPGRMCNFRVRLGDPKEVDGELMDWIRSAYEAAG